MKSIALIKNNIIENIVVVDDTSMALELGYDEFIEMTDTSIGIGWVRIDGMWMPPEAQAVQLKSVLTPLEFLNRFTDTELATILTITKTDVNVELWWLKYNKAQDMDLDDPQTIGGVNALEQLGLIGTGRAAEILTKYPV